MAYSLVFAGKGIIGIGSFVFWEEEFRKKLCKFPVDPDALNEIAFSVFTNPSVREVLFNKERVYPMFLFSQRRQWNDVIFQEQGIAPVGVCGIISALAYNLSVMGAEIYINPQQIQK